MTGIYDSNGDVVANYLYDTWGKIVCVTDANGNAITDSSHIGNMNPIRYRGYYYDTKTGYYYLESRYYNPEWGRFLNADALFIAGSFAYCFNNPVVYSDPSGYIPIKDLYAGKFLLAAESLIESTGTGFLLDMEPSGFGPYFDTWADSGTLWVTMRWVKDADDFYEMTMGVGTVREWNRLKVYIDDYEDNHPFQAFIYKLIGSILSAFADLPRTVSIASDVIDFNPFAMYTKFRKQIRDGTDNRDGSIIMVMVTSFSHVEYSLQRDIDNNWVKEATIYNYITSPRYYYY
ncbi:MAG: RHS repeat-associated core domain-containing protein [Oscillospiraceae bacterium]|nr:RHS repeat-associated core domain-containing protein [Oscillospiraceae bacterium]